MRLERIYLQNFTNYASQDCMFGENINVFQGENAQGKSNFLDAIYYLSRACSYRHNKDKELMRWEQPYFRIKAIVSQKNEKHTITLTYHEGKKTVLLDETPLQSLDQLAGTFLTVIFSPEDLALVKGSPDHRRKFLDDELIQTDRQYARELYRYKKIIQQRNHVLKTMRQRYEEDDLLQVYDDQLAVCGLFILQRRLAILDKLNPLAAKAHDQLTDGKEKLSLRYLCNLPGDVCGLTEKDYLKALQERRQEDVNRGYSTLGPHRDDLELTIDGHSAKTYGSQGQQRTVALSLKMAEADYIQFHEGEYPVLLLDDVLSELDGTRRESLLRLVNQNIQTFITCTDAEDMRSQTLHFEEFIIKDGKII